MFRILLKFSIVLSIILIAVFYYYPLSQGQTPESPFERISVIANNVWLKIRNTDLSLPKLPESKPDSNGPVTLYRWQDATGQWHFSNSPPLRTVKTANFSSLVVNPDANLIQSIQPSQQLNKEDDAITKPLKNTEPNEQPSPYSKEAIEQLFIQAETIRDNSKQRQKIMQNLTQETR